MKHIKPFTTFLFTLILFVSFQSSANIDDATWYVSIDVDQIESNEIYKIFQENVNKSSNDIPDKFKKMPEEISYISLYGNAKGAEDATAVIHGDFSQFSISEYILELVYSQEKDISEVIKESAVDYKNHEIKVLQINEDERHGNQEVKEVYFSKVNNDVTVISFKLDEVKNWLDHNYDNHQINKGSLFSVEVDVQSALAHMGMNIDKNNHMMESEIFQKVTQASASISEVNSDMLIDVALTTDDEATAIQIEQVINGLVAMSSLSGANDENELQATLIQNLNIERNGGNILINTYASVEDIKKMALEQHIINDDNIKIKVNVEL